MLRKMPNTGEEVLVASALVIEDTFFKKAKI